MQIDIRLGGHLRHSVDNADRKTQLLRHCERLTVSQVVNRLSIKQRETEILVTVDGENIPPEQRANVELRNGQTMVITPWYAHLRLTA